MKTAIPGQQPETSPVHDLLSREIRPLRNWKEWLDRWQSAVSLQEMLGLLHGGFDVTTEKSSWEEPAYNQLDRISFYLRLADGWIDSSRLRKPEDRGLRYDFRDKNAGSSSEKEPFELRMMVARKAFDMLCLHFFRQELPPRPGDREYESYWSSLTANGNLLPLLMKFFRVEPSEIKECSIENLCIGLRDGSHNQKHAMTFLKNLATFLWHWEKPDLSFLFLRDEEKKTRERQASELEGRIEEAKPWMIEVLVSLDEIDILSPIALSLDKKSLGKLREIALRQNLECAFYPVEKDRKVRSIEEACYAGSKAAWFLKMREICLQEQTRLEEIQKAQQAKDAADRKLRHLAGT